jgi:hypothetical protein
MRSAIRRTTFTPLVMAAAMAILAVPAARPDAQHQPEPAAVAAEPMFHPATYCMTCHNGLTTPAGEDVSMGTRWRGSMMANSARDPYWHVGVRRETIDHPAAQAEIENECSRCHMPMAHVRAHALGRHLAVFTNLPAPGRAADPLASDGVSCALCHQVTPAGLGTTASFNGGFTVDTATPAERRPMFGPYDVDGGRTALMGSATGFQPTQGTHLQDSAMCGTCHTLYTRALDEQGRPGDPFPEQMPYREWLQSEFRDRDSCQSCHMPEVEQPTPITSVLGEPRDRLSRHDFRGANFLMPRVLNRFRADLGVTARPAELEDAAVRSRTFLQASTATLEVASADVVAGRLEADVVVRALAGHKVPTGYPSRRVWLAVTVMDADARVVFSSGVLQPSGAIAGNDNDEDAARFEPHYREVRSPDQVQIYEAIMGTRAGTVTTGLLSAVSYLKDNRLLPRGFDKADAPDDVAVHGDAREDPDFGGGEDHVRYSVDVRGGVGPFTLRAELWYQPIAYRWVENLRAYDAPEPRRFVDYYAAMAPSSGLVMAATARSTER